MGGMRAIGRGRGTPAQQSWQWCAVAAVIALLALPLLLTLPASAGDLNDRLVTDLGDGRLDNCDFVGAALVASGVSDECELAGWLAAYDDRRQAVLDSLADYAPELRLLALHQGLHEHVLTGRYETAASDLRQTIADGRFNCLSAVALYVDLCDAAELPVQIWLSRGHVFVRAATDNGLIDIEPATPEWTDRLVMRRRGVRQISPVELLGKFYYNRGVELLKDRQFVEGIELVETSLQLDAADRDARANLVAGLNNWAVDLLKSGSYEQAALRIGQGLAIDPGFAPLVANRQFLRTVGQASGLP
jgi:tetratricopeptide (TPR) repeat protein